MAINNKIKEEISKVKLGTKYTFTQFFDEGDNKSPSLAEKDLKELFDKKNLVETLQTIYDKTEKKYKVSEDARKKIFITDNKTSKTGEITVRISGDVIVIMDTLNGLRKRTEIEMEKKYNKKPLKEKLQDAIKQAKNETQLLKLVRAIVK